MALIVPGVSVSTSSEPTLNKIIETRVADVKDTFINRTSIMPSRYPDIYGTLMDYVHGSQMKVEYYNQHTPMINKQTHEIDLSSFRHSIHTDYMLVHDFEVKMEGQLDITYDDETTEMIIIGTALVYPGFIPNLGDVLLYKLPDAQIGMFVITNIFRLSIQQGSYHRVTFSLYKFADEDDLTKLNTSVSSEVYFDKQKYLSGNSTLLSSTDYLYLKDLRQYRAALIQYYFNKFFSNDLQTIIRPDGIYDPYIIEFLHTKVSLFDTRKRPMQIYPEVTDHFSSIWFMLSEGESIDVSTLVFKTFTIQHETAIWASNVTQLINRPFIQLDDRGLLNAKQNLRIIGDEEDSTYIFSRFFYSGTLEFMSDFEKLVYIAITTQQIDIGILIDTYVKAYRSLTPMDQFYHIGLYLYLIDLAVSNIT